MSKTKKTDAPKPGKPVKKTVPIPGGAERPYQSHVVPTKADPKGLFARKLSAEKAKALGAKCLFCATALKNKLSGRRRIICKGKPCFKRYRQAYAVDVKATTA